MTNYTAAQKAFYAADFCARLDMLADAHEEALCMNEWYGYTAEQIAIHHQRVIYGLELRAAMSADSVLEACHAEALEMNRLYNINKRPSKIHLLNAATGKSFDECNAALLEADCDYAIALKILNKDSNVEVADKGLFLYAVYRHEWKECGGYVDAHADIKMIPCDGKVQLHLRTSAASWWVHDSTHIDAASAYACACAIFETTDFVKLDAGHA